MADRSVSVPMTLNDLEMPDAKNQFFSRRILITLVRSMQPRHCNCTNASRGLSATAVFLVLLLSHEEASTRNLSLYSLYLQSWSRISHK